MSIKLATPTPLTFVRRSDPGKMPFFYATERPALSICIDKYGDITVQHGGEVAGNQILTLEEGEYFANELHARLCTFEQPQTAEEPAHPTTTVNNKDAIRKTVHSLLAEHIAPQLTHEVYNHLLQRRVIDGSLSYKNLKEIICAFPEFCYGRYGWEFASMPAKTKTVKVWLHGFVSNTGKLEGLWFTEDEPQPPYDFVKQVTLEIPVRE